MKNFGYIDIDEERDRRPEDPIMRTVQVFEWDELKSRPIGFIWDQPNRIIRDV